MNFLDNIFVLITYLLIKTCERGLRVYIYELFGQYLTGSLHMNERLWGGQTN
jgi:hypothetical protein